MAKPLAKLQLESKKLRNFLAKMTMVSERKTPPGYCFMWDGIPCLSYVTWSGGKIHMDIYPCSRRDDIGAGPGVMVPKAFWMDKLKKPVEQDSKAT